MTEYVLDTNHVTRLLSGADPLRQRVQAAVTTGDRFGITMSILGEMYYAAYASQRRDENLHAIRAFLADIWLWPYDERAAEEFGRIQAEQKVKGRPIPQIDAQIAAVVRLQRLTLLTADQHFQSVAGLTIENWLMAD